MCERFGSLGGALQVGRHNACRGQRSQGGSSELCLVMTKVVEFDVGVALEPTFGVPASLPVPKQDDTQGGQDYSPALSAALTGGEITRVGQSFHKRSRA